MDPIITLSFTPITLVLLYLSLGLMYSVATYTMAISLGHTLPRNPILSTLRLTMIWPLALILGVAILCTEAVDPNRPGARPPLGTGPQTGDEDGGTKAQGATDV